MFIQTEGSDAVTQRRRSRLTVKGPPRRAEWVPAHYHAERCGAFDDAIKPLLETSEKYQAAKDASGWFFARSDVVLAYIEAQIPEGAKEGDEFQLCPCGQMCVLRKHTRSIRVIPPERKAEGKRAWAAVEAAKEAGNDEGVSAALEAYEALMEIRRVEVVDPMFRMWPKRR